MGVSEMGVNTIERKRLLFSVPNVDEFARIVVNRRTITTSFCSVFGCINVSRYIPSISQICRRISRVFASDTHSSDDIVTLPVVHLAKAENFPMPGEKLRTSRHQPFRSI
jgi:hypothetical protein